MKLRTLTDPELNREIDENQKDLNEDDQIDDQDIEDEMRKSVYNQLYEDDAFKQLKEAMFKEMQMLDE